MIQLTSAAQARQLAGRIPAVAVERMVQFEGEDGSYDPEAHGCILVLEKGDDLAQDVPMLGENGLRGHLEETWPFPFEYVFFVREQGRRIFEAAIAVAGEAMLVLIVPEAPWLDERLLQVLASEARETA